jgi:hypothetical protein
MDLLATWPTFHPGAHAPQPAKRSVLADRTREQILRRQEREMREKLAARRRTAQRRALGRPPRPPPARFKPLLPKHAATTPFSFSALQALPTSFSKRLAAIPQKAKSPFEVFETARMRIRRIALEKRWAHPEPTFYERLVADVEKDHQKEMRLRFAFRSLLLAWRYRRYVRRAGTPVDPVTLDAIRVPVYIMDYKAKRAFFFEASALNQLVRQALVFQLYTVPNAQAPKNPYTNLPFTFGQLVGLHQQLMGRGRITQEFHMLRSLGFCLQRFKSYMGDWLHLEAQRQELFDVSSADGQEILGDFMVGCLEDLGRLPDPPLETLVRDAVAMVPDHEILGKIRALCMRELEAEYFGMPMRRTVLLQFHTLFQSRSDLWRRVRECRAANEDATE